MKRLRVLLPLCVVLVLGCMSAGVAFANETGFTFSYQAEPIESPEPLVVKEIVIVTEFVEVEKIVTEVVTEVVEVVKEVPIKLVDWESEEELKAFLEQDNTDSVVHFTCGKDGAVRFDGRCEVRALQLIDRASEMGKRLFFVPLNRMEFCKWYKGTLARGHYHAICGALIGDNEFWYIEPSDDKCWHSLNLE